MNVTQEITTAADPVSDHPHYDKTARIASFSSAFLLGLIGNTCVFFWIHKHRKERTRFHTYILYLALADLSVLFFPILGELVIEIKGKEWYSGDFFCRIFHVAESVALFSSSFMLAGIAIDRYHSVTHPLKKQLSAPVVISICWLAALLLSLPQFHIFQKRSVKGEYYCKTPFISRSDWRLKVYFMYVTMAAYLTPLCIMCFTYACILHRLWMGQGSRMFQTKTSWQRTSRWRTLKMTFVIIGVYIICQTPFFLTEIILVFSPGLSKTFNRVLYAVFAIFAVCNSTANPYVFLYFNVCNPTKKSAPDSKTNQTNLDQSQYSMSVSKFKTRYNNFRYGPECSKTPSTIADKI